MKDWLPLLVARAPLRVYTKLNGAFLAIVAVLIIFGVVVIHVLGGVNHRYEDVSKLQRKVAALRQLQHDTTSQLYALTSALVSPDQQTLDSALRQLQQSLYDLERLQFVTHDKEELFQRIQEEHGQLIQAITKVLEYTREHRFTKAQELWHGSVSPKVDAFERLTNETVNRAEADKETKIDETNREYVKSRWLVIGFAVVSIGLAILLGYAVSSSLMGPVKIIDEELKQIASHNFTGNVEIPNKDELGRLANNLNHMSTELNSLYTNLEQRVKDQVEQIGRLGRLKRFFSPQIAELIIAGGADNPLKAHRREVTIVSLDLRGFTAFTEASEPEEVVSVLNEYHDEMCKLMVEYEGALENFAGDGMMIVLNDPVILPNPTERAVRMVSAMRFRMAEIKEKWQKSGYNLDCGFGIAHGFATIGSIGFEGREDYCVVGSVANMAARLCAEAKGGQILINQKTLANIEEFVETEFVEQLSLKGFSKPVPVYNVISVKNN